MIKKLGLVQISKGQVGVRQIFKGGNYYFLNLEIVAAIFQFYTQ